MIHCSQARGWFGAYWDDEITQAERESLESHFVSCATCRGEYEELARTLEVIGSLPRHEVSPDFAERTLARIRRTASAPDRLSVARPAWVPIAAAATVLAVAATVLAPGFLARGRGPAPVATRAVAPREPQLTVPVGTTPATVPAGPAAQEPVAAMVDSLIDHSEDVDFVLDPVLVSRGRTATSPLTGPVRGQQAVITF